MNVKLSSGIRSLKFSQSLYIRAYFGFVSSQGADETALMRSLASALATRSCNDVLAPIYFV